MYSLGNPLNKGKGDQQFTFKPTRRSHSVPPTRKRAPIPRQMPYQSNTLDAFGKRVVQERQYAADIRYLELQLEEVSRRLQNIDLTQYHIARSLAEMKQELSLLNTTLILSRPTPSSIVEQWCFNDQI